MYDIIRHPYGLVAALATMAAGLLHATIIAVEHLGIPPEFLFFLFTGFFQVVWGFNFLYHRTPNWFYAGVVLNLGLTFFWLFARTLPAPFAEAPESIEMLGVLTAAIQIIAVAASFWCLYRTQAVTYARLAAVVFFSLILAMMGYAAAKGTEDAMRALWPEIKEGAHLHGTDDDHGEARAEEPHDDMGTMPHGH